MSYKTPIVAGVACACVLACALEARAASITGQVRARDGARLPAAVVTVTDARTGSSWRTVSSELGTFALTGLPPGVYDVRVELDGFGPFTAAGIDLARPDAAAVVDPVLDVQSVHEVVTVIAGAPRDSVENAALRESAARDVGESLTAAAGAWQLRKGGIASDVVLRGLQSRDLNVLIDGQRTYGACPNHMDPPAFHVDFAEVERVEVEKGPFDVRHQGSLGGLVNVVTRRPEAGWHGTMAIGLGAGGYANPSATVSYGSGRVLALGGGSFRRAEPYRSGDGRRFTEVTNYTAAAIDAEAFRVGTGWGRVVAKLTDAHRLQLSYTRQQADRVFYPYLQMDGIWDTTDRASARYDATETGPFDALQAQIYVTRVDHWMTDEYRTSAAGKPRAYSMGTQADTRTTGGRVEASAGALTTGVEIVRRWWNSATVLAGRQYGAQASLPGVLIDTAGAFADWRRPLGAGLSLEIGGRLDRVASRADEAIANTNLYYAYHQTRSTSRDDVLPAGKVKLAGQSGPVRWTVAAGHTARVAEGNERYFALQRAGSDWVGNPDLRPARNTGVDAGITWTGAGASLSAQAYAYRVDGYIAVYDQTRMVMVPGVMNAMARTYASLEATMTGFEASASVPAGPRVFVSGDLSYVRGSHAGDSARGIQASPLAEMPALRGRMRARYDDGRAFALAEQVVTGDQDRVDPNLGESPTPGAGFTNLSAGYRWSRMTITAGVSNLFDRYYVDALSYQRDPFRTGTRVPEPGRQWFANLAWRF